MLGTARPPKVQSELKAGGSSNGQASTGAEGQDHKALGKARQRRAMLGNRM